jgi:DNA-binding MarR family transcriptional regulator
MSSPTDPGPVPRQLDQSLRDAAVQTVLLHQAVADRLGMNLTAFECFTLLTQHGPMPAGQLADLTGLTTGGITHAVDRLEKAGWVRRESDPDDRRRVILVPVAERSSEITSLLAPLGLATGLLAGNFSEAELAIVLGFQERLQPIMQREVAHLRATGNLFQASAGAGLSMARLVVQSDVPRLALRAEPDLGQNLTDLYRVQFDGPPPRARVQADGTVSLRFSGGLRLAAHGVQPRVEVWLNPNVPWQVEVYGGVAHLEVDFELLECRGLEVRGGVGGADLRLPRPTETVRVRFRGGMSGVRISRPATVPVRLRMTGGANRLVLDTQLFDVVGGATDWQSPGFDTADARYEVEVSGGANGLTIETY